MAEYNWTNFQGVLRSRCVTIPISGVSWNKALGRWNTRDPKRNDVKNKSCSVRQILSRASRGYGKVTGDASLFPGTKRSSIVTASVVAIA